ncbi:MAG TPA: DUF4870 domain-containing protein [Candidatus Acidoferrales bacterium]|nr:DUF4870 domain-containing protein [Candidatus Acidoferrales bacterium]
MESQTTMTPAAPLTTEERNWAMAAHLTALVAIIGLPLGHMVGPLVVYLIKYKESEFVAEHARASLNYQITITIAAVIAAIIGFVVFAIVMVTVAAGPSTHGSGTSDAAGIGLIALWAFALLVIAAFIIVSIIFIIMGTMAAGAGRPYTYPFAIKFLR